MTARRKDITAELAKSITWAGSKQTYYTATLLVDRDLVDDFYRAYAYFRWIDDVIDISARTDEERITFIVRQRELINRLYGNHRPDDLTPQEEILADLINNDRGENSCLQSYIRNMFAMIEFDAVRKGRLVSQAELTWYVNTLAKSVTDGLLYFVGNGYPYPDNENRYLAGTAAHITHLLRDMHKDTADGFINIPREYLESHSLKPVEMDNPNYRAWVRERVELAREYFTAGKRYLGELDVLRCKIVGHWYCARFEIVLDTIERDGYTLRKDYEERRRLSSWFKIAWLGISLTISHIFHRRKPDSSDLSGNSGMNATLTKR